MVRARPCHGGILIHHPTSGADVKFDEGSCWLLQDPRDQTRAVRLLIDFLIEGRPLWSPLLTLFNSIFLKSPSDFLNLCGCELGGSWFFPRPEFSGLHLFSTTLPLLKLLYLPLISPLLSIFIP